MGRYDSEYLVKSSARYLYLVWNRNIRAPLVDMLVTSSIILELEVTVVNKYHKYYYFGMEDARR